jgi:hypothetical protein
LFQPKNFGTFDQQNYFFNHIYIKILTINCISILVKIYISQPLKINELLHNNRVQYFVLARYRLLDVPCSALLVAAVPTYGNRTLLPQVAPGGFHAL